MELNKEIKLPHNGLFDVAGLGRNQCLLYFKEEGKIIVKCNADMATIDNETKYGGRAIVLTASKCERRYPQVFTDSSKVQFSGNIRTIILRVPSHIYMHCRKQGNITAYLKSLIEKDMEKSE